MNRPKQICSRGRGQTHRTAEPHPLPGPHTACTKRQPRHAIRTQRKPAIQIEKPTRCSEQLKSTGNPFSTPGVNHLPSGASHFVHHFWVNIVHHPMVIRCSFCDGLETLCLRGRASAKNSDFLVKPRISLLRRVPPTQRPVKSSLFG